MQRRAQRMHDNKAFRETAMEPGTRSLLDLGYLDVERFIEPPNAKPSS